MSWKVIKLTDICDFQGGTQPPKSEWSNEPRNGFVRMLQIRDFTQGKEKYIAFVKDSQKLKKCESEDILIGRYGASVGKILTGLSGAYNVALIKTNPNQKLITKKFLYYLLIGEGFQNFILNVGNRAAQAGFNKNDLTDFEFSLPDLQTQQQIVTVLDKAQALIKKREQSLELLDELLRATFLDMFGDPILNEKEWKTALLSNTKYFKVQGGGTPSKQREEFYGGNVPWVTPKDMKFEIIKNSKIRITENAIINSSAKLIDPFSTIIVVRSGILKHSFPVGINTCSITINQDLKAITPLKTLPYFTYWNIKLYEKYILNKVRGVTADNIDSKELKKFKILLPENQNDFEKIAISFYGYKAIIQKSLKETKNLFQALLQDAFSGTLTLQDDKIELQRAIKDVNWFTEQVGEITNNTATQKLFAALNTLPKMPSAFSHISELQKKLNASNLALDKIRKFQNTLGTNSIAHLKFVNSLPAFKLVQQNSILKQITNNQPYTLKSFEQAGAEQKNNELEEELRKENDPVLQFINQEQLGKYSIDTYKVNISKAIHEYFGKREFDIDTLIQVLEENKAISGIKKDTIKKDLFLIFTQFIKVKFDGLFAFKQMREEMQRSLFNPAFTLLQEFVDQGLKNKSIEQVYSLASVGDDILGNDKRIYLSLKRSEDEN
ncbi:restriction endonuclease subunit S [Aquimarina muelleri]|uniref:restriction endonuclease subunit S n=1 Tax=Aquimarina muelleri TaxID=279356 RepID=UPI003F688585